MEKEVAPPTTTTITTLSKPSKKRRSLGVLLSSFLARNRPLEKKPEPEKPTGRLWKAVICGLRPLHHLDQAPLTPRPIPLPLQAPDSFHDVALPPSSPTSSMTSGMSSRYASAADLQALDDDYDGDDEHLEGKAALGGPNLIDMQAEEFIARFYEQIKLQRLKSMEIQRGA